MRFRSEWLFAFVVLFLGCLFLAFPQSLWARSHVSLSGVVRDVCGRPMTGAPGHEIWLFRALEEGRSVILLDYSRSWEVDRAPERVAILVTVSEKRF
ncbi:MULTISPECIES: protease inhibitor I42 family protein [Dethiosulfovibrio]|uniref:Protease inhibitor I42 family protein n=2 Tax=Dethiosulfovibrio TaxID=47054 RepID=A0ABS9EQK0_9BACT|nr:MULTISPECIES: protease inhibitor I42 family protein [Dethiosulfovibrio]MCF4115091.1 protease inhibitor I42 family protein [Dethiosulfovibrio russensis]MCF4143467.1 protease inhibitor I42 family protein [Dethiosulfovibrio marinus]MCF4145718.1 protease inhibitor I42 family protein [Dethiosulfovibrio acidaminovorans]